MKLEQHPVYLHLQTTVFLLLSLSAHAEFSISGKLSYPEPGTKLQLFRQTLETGIQNNEAELTIQSDHSIEKVFNIEPGLFDLKLPGWGSIPLAIANGQHLSITVNSDNPADFSVSGSPDTDLLSAYETFRKDSLERLVYPPRAELNNAAAAHSQLSRKLKSMATTHIVVNSMTSRSSMLKTRWLSMPLPSDGTAIIGWMNCRNRWMISP